MKDQGFPRDAAQYLRMCFYMVAFCLILELVSAWLAPVPTAPPTDLGWEGVVFWSAASYLWPIIYVTAPVTVVIGAMAFWPSRRGGPASPKSAREYLGQDRRDISSHIKSGIRASILESIQFVALLAGVAIVWYVYPRWGIVAATAAFIAFAAAMIVASAWAKARFRISQNAQ